MACHGKQQVEKIEEDYQTAKKADIQGGATTASLGVGVAALGPTVAMGFATTFGVASTGTAISSLSGAAATNAALAWLGGGALSAGGGGMAAGNLFLGMFGSVGWTIAGVALLSSALLFGKTKQDRDRLEEIFLLISKRDQNSYKQAIVELNERIKRVIDETGKINDAIDQISMFGLDYSQMTEEQQYKLGTYVNLMNAATQLLVTPILGLQTKYSINNLNEFLINLNEFLYRNIVYPVDKNHKELIVYMANMFFKIDLNDSDRKLVSKSFKNNKDFRKKMNLKKCDINVDLFKIVDIILKYQYQHQRNKV